MAAVGAAVAASSSSAARGNLPPTSNNRLEAFKSFFLGDDASQEIESSQKTAPEATSKITSSTFQPDEPKLKDVGAQEDKVHKRAHFSKPRSESLADESEYQSEAWTEGTPEQQDEDDYFDDSDESGDSITKCSQCIIDPKKVTHRDENWVSRLLLNIHLVFEHSNSSTCARFMQFAVILAIVVSTLVLVISKEDEIQGWEGWKYIEAIVSLFFSMELLLRFISCKSKLAFAKNIMNWIDVAAVLPWYVDLGVDGNQNSLQTVRVIRIIRLVRIFRLLKIGRFMKFLYVFKVTLQESSEALVLLLFFVLIIAIILGTVMATIEGGTYDESIGKYVRSDGSISPFNNVRKGIYWAITTLTTVGYGDLYPVEVAGRAIANMGMVSGILVFALPLAVVGSQFQAAFDRYKMDRMKAQRRKKKGIRDLQMQMDRVSETHDELNTAITELMFMMSNRKSSGYDAVEDHWKVQLKNLETSCKALSENFFTLVDKDPQLAKRQKNRKKQGAEQAVGSTETSKNSESRLS